MFFGKKLVRRRKLWQYVLVCTAAISGKKNCSDRKNRKRKD